MQRRTQAERSAATRRSLVDAGRALFAARGYDRVGTNEIAEAAGVSRGALYHQYPDKAALFADVAEAVEVDVTEAITVSVLGAGGPAEEALGRAVTAWLDAAASTEARQVLLLDAPRVLGWSAWRALALRHGQGLTEALLADAIDRGVIAGRPVGPLAQILIGALNEAALLLADCGQDPEVRAEVEDLLAALLSGLAP